MKFGLKFFGFSCVILLVVSQSLATSIGAEVEKLVQCSKYDFEEKVLDKVLRMNLKMETFETLMKSYETEFKTGLEKITEAKMETLKVIESSRDDAAKFIANLKREAEETMKTIKRKIENLIDEVKNQMFTITTESKMGVANSRKLVEDYNTKAESRLDQLLKDTTKRSEDFVEKSRRKLEQDQSRLNETIKHVTETSTELVSTTKQTLKDEQGRINDSMHTLGNHLAAQMQNRWKDFLAKQKALETELSIIKNKQPVAFSASLTKHISVPSGNAIKFDKVWTNLLNGYNPSTGVFTAPVDGLYFFTCTLVSSGGTFRGILYRNGNSQSVISYSISNRDTGNLHTVLTLNKGDRVDIRKSPRNGNEVYSESTHHFSMFTGFKI